MNDEGAFLAAIIAEPDEDTPRLAFTDWLDEHGQPERAEFIRLQIEVARRPGGAESAKLSQRADELLRRHYKEWFGISWGGSLTWASRGMLTCLEGTAAQIAGMPKRVWQRNPIQELVVDGYAGRLDRVLALPQLPRIRRLWLFSQGTRRATTADIKALANCTLLTGLESFTTSGDRDDNSARWGNGLATALARCPSARGLTELSLLDVPLDNEGAAALCSAADNLRRLKRLRLSKRSIGSGTAAALARTPALAGLEFLQLWKGSIGDAGAAALAGSPHLAGLRELELFSQDIGPAGAAALAATPHLTRLVRLCLSGNREIGVDGAGAVVSGRWPELTTLEMSDCLLFAAAAEAMARSGRLNSLVELDLKRNKIGPDGATALSRAEWLARLVKLNLRGNPIGDAGARALCKSKTLKKLKELHVDPPDGEFSPSVAAALKKRFGSAD